MLLCNNETIPHIVDTATKQSINPVAKSITIVNPVINTIFLPFD